MSPPDHRATTNTSQRPWWVSLLHAPLPVLPATHAALQDWHDGPDQIDAHLLTQTLSTDPLATLQLFRCVADRQQGRGRGVETVTEALVMLGIDPFLQAFPRNTRTTTQWLATRPAEATALHEWTRASQRRAQIALSLALYLQDPRAHHVYTTALLDRSEDLLALLAAPHEPQTDTTTQSLDQNLNAPEGVNPSLDHVLHELWRLPPLLRHMHDPTQQHRRDIRCATLAARVLRIFDTEKRAFETGTGHSAAASLTDELQEFLQCQRNQLPQILGLDEIE